MENLYRPSQDDIVSAAGELDIELSYDEINKISLNDVKLPYILKNKRLLSPGTHNGHLYTPELIRKSWMETVFTQDNTFLNLNHEDDNVDKDVGYVKNITWNNSDGSLYGDLWIYDPITALKHMLGARFGISIKGSGSSYNNTVQNLIYKNFGIVKNPACQTTYLNSQQKQKGDVMTEVHNISLTDDEKPEDAGKPPEPAPVAAQTPTPQPAPQPQIDKKYAEDLEKVKSDLAKIQAEKEAALKAEAERKAAEEKAKAEAVAQELQQLKEYKAQMEAEQRKAASVLNPRGEAKSKQAIAKSFEEKLSSMKSRERSDMLDEAFAQYVMKKSRENILWEG